MGMGFTFGDMVVKVGPIKSSVFVEDAIVCRLFWTATRRSTSEFNGGSPTHRRASSSIALSVHCSPSHIPLMAQPNLPLPPESTNLSSASSILFTVGKFHHRRFIPVTHIDLNGTRS
ncbi:unnamed protein product [Arabis nemorensis]|uniref:Uncharacterized protein n=1 Tax=Arabis nemorensis TaxID=586526 RepID=A0A565BUH6_9BRAS|nr:unnamed protein product [Arabis nemorensis]